jgi:hypothetical protein
MRQLPTDVRLVLIAVTATIIAALTVIALMLPEVLR